ncbi:MFS transporter [Streptomyces scopuliridis]|uniref:MFS transporter n=1 Tax=Streptomyces scopuliridis TaxID=452529 RepID=UPI002DDAB86D|nr:MFS transporter [Streptomyces scopuliridis]WSB34758.1 MFS transporter [Streptomyces scopuliridis]
MSDSKDMSTIGRGSRAAGPWAALAALSLGLFMIVVDTSIVSVAVPTMVRDLNTGLNAVVWVTSVYLLMYAVPMLFTSRLGDRYGPKRVFVAGLAVFTGASLCAGLSASVETLIAARAAQGLGAALLTPQTLTLITHLFPGGDRGRAMGFLGGASGLATVTGPLLGGVLVDGLGWQWIFYVNVVQNGQAYHWGELLGPITVFEVVAVGVTLLVAFVVWQRVTRNERLVPLRTFADRNFSMGALTTAALGFAITGMFLPLVIYMQSALGSPRPAPDWSPRRWPWCPASWARSSAVFRTASTASTW